MGFQRLIAIRILVTGIQDVVADHLDALHLLAVDLSRCVCTHRYLFPCINAVVYHGHILQELSAGVIELAVEADHINGRLTVVLHDDVEGEQIPGFPREGDVRYFQGASFGLCLLDTSRVVRRGGCVIAGTADDMPLTARRNGLEMVLAGQANENALSQYNGPERVEGFIFYLRIVRGMFAFFAGLIYGYLGRCEKRSE